MPSSLSKSVITLGALSGVLLSGLPVALGIDEAQKFLGGLRARGFYDTALEYLERSKTSPFISEEFKGHVLYHQGIILLEQTLHTANGSAREAQEDRAISLLRRYCHANPNTFLGTKAGKELATWLIKRGAARALQVEKLPAEAGVKPLLHETRGLLTEGLTLLDASESFYLAELQKIPKILDANKDSAISERRQKLRSELLHTQLLMATGVFEKAKTYAKNSQDRRQLVQSAATRYGDLHKKYRKRMIGLHAHLQEGRCYQELGQLDQAIGCYQDLILLPSKDADVRRLITKAVRSQAECFFAKKKYREAIATCRAWLHQALVSEKIDPDWLGVKYQQALAHLHARGDLSEESPDSAKHLREARRLARPVSLYQNEFQTDANDLLQDLGGTESFREPATFVEAFTMAQQAYQLVKTAKVGLRLAHKNNPAMVPQLNDQLSRHLETALRSSRKALKLANKNTPLGELNQARLYLCAVHWELGHHYDAAVLGEFLVHNYPEDTAAQKGATIAISSYQKAYRDPHNMTKQIDATRLADIARRIATQWTGRPVADHAYALLIRFAIRDGDLPITRKYLESISATHRGPSEIQIGVAYWNAYLRHRKLHSTDAPENHPPEHFRQIAQETLEQVLGRFKEKNLNTTTATAALTLAQIYLDQSLFQQAIDFLENDQIGPLTLLSATSASSVDPHFVEETYKAGARAYLSVHPPNREEAQAIMDRLDSHVLTQDHGTTADKLTQWYVALGHHLQNNFQESAWKIDPHAQKPSIEGLVFLLDRVKQRGEQIDWPTRNWLAESYYQMALSLDHGAQLSNRARSYYTQSVAEYRGMIQDALAHPEDPPSKNTILFAKMRLATSFCKLQQYRQSLDLFAEILTAKENMMAAQVAAAYAYQQRADRELPKWYRFAWQGGRKDAKTNQNRIWGWDKLARIAVRYKEHRDLFYEARYNLALCRFRYACKQHGKQSASQKKFLELAKNDIRFMVQLYPDLGGQVWRAKYEQLLKAIQTRLQENPIGFESFSLRNTADSNLPSDN